MQLLQECYLLDNIQILNEGGKKGPMRIRGVFQRADEENVNKRIYRKPLLESQIERLKPFVNERRLTGELDHPASETVRLANASHLITNLYMKGNEVIGECELLNTPAGLTAQSLINDGVKLGISSRGMGTLSEDSEGKRYVNDDFRLITFDLVADPSTRGAFPALSESMLVESTRILQESARESAFIVLLEAKLQSKLSAGNYDYDEVKDSKFLAKHPPKLRRMKFKGIPNRAANPKKKYPHGQKFGRRKSSEILARAMNKKKGDTNPRNTERSFDTGPEVTSAIERKQQDLRNRARQEARAKGKSYRDPIGNRRGRTLSDEENVKRNKERMSRNLLNKMTRKDEGCSKAKKVLDRVHKGKYDDEIFGPPKQIDTIDKAGKLVKRIIPKKK